MKIDIRSSRTKQSVAFSCELNFSHVKMWGQAILLQPVKITGEAVDKGDFYEISYTADYVLHTQCARCLKPLKIAKTGQYVHDVMEPETYDPTDEDIFLNQGILDVNAMACGDVLPEIENTFLCSQNCKGLCPVCGRDLNESECGCDTSVPDPRFDKLLELMDKLENKDNQD